MGFPSTPRHYQGKPVHGPHSCHAVSRAEARDVRVALSGEFLDSVVQRVHASCSLFSLDTVILIERSMGGSGHAIKLLKD
jgi:hypothetical protein